ncbi:MAG TPA: tetratricopeptide repeat protein [Candidatus Omnitrophota bacterium]|nr:tetratricopeptide repeat protein [Candidatus Omnitrophota bacterium]
MKKNNAQTVPMLILAGLLFASFMVFESGFHGPDEPIYFAYTQSVAENGDLNPVDQMNAAGSPMSVTGNYMAPDYHNSGGVVLWLPFYVLGKASWFIAGALKLAPLHGAGLSAFTHTAMSLSTVVFGFAALLLTYILCRYFVRPAWAITSVVVMLFGTPFFYYWVYDTGNANIAITLASVVSLLFLKSILARRAPYWFMYGLFFSFCMVVKIDIRAQIISIAAVAVYQIMRGKISWKSVVSFCTGMAFFYVMKIINNAVLFRSLWAEEFMFANLLKLPAGSYDALFDPYRGLFYMSPVLYLVIAGIVAAAFFVFARTKHSFGRRASSRVMFLLFLSAPVVVKLVLFRNLFQTFDSSFIFRHLMTEWPVLVLLLAFLLEKLPAVWKGICIGLAGLGIIANFVSLSQFMAGLDWLTATGIVAKTDTLFNVRLALDELFRIRAIPVKIAVAVPILAAAMMVTWVIRRVRRSIPWTVMTTLAVCAFYAAVTAANWFVHDRNMLQLRRSGFFDNAVAVESLETVFERNEVSYALLSLERFYSERGDLACSRSVNESKPADGLMRNSLSFYPGPIEAYRDIRTRLEAQGRYAMAIECYKRLIAINPGNIDLYPALGDLYYACGDYAAAAQCYKETIGHDEGFILMYFKTGDAYAKAGNKDEAVRWLETAFARAQNSRFSASWLRYIKLLGEIHEESGRYKDAVRAYTAALAYRPDDSDIIINCALVYERLGDYPSAIALLERMTGDSAAGAYANQKAGELYAFMGDTKKAEAHLLKSLMIDQRNPAVHMALGDLYAKERSYDKAVKAYDKAVSIAPYTYPAYFGIAELYIDQGDIVRAEEILTRLTRQNIDRADVYLRLAQYFNRINNAERAGTYATKAHELDPGMTAVYAILGEAAATEADYRRAIEWFEKASNADIDSPSILARLGECYAMVNDHEKAAASYRHAIKLSPGDFDNYIVLGDILAKSGRADEAIACLREAAAIDERAPRIYIKLGKLYLKKGAYENAIESFMRVLKLDPESVEVYSMLADACEALDRKDEALDAVRKLVALKPDDAGGYNRLAHLYAARGIRDAARTAFEKAIELDPLSHDSYAGLAMLDAEENDYRNAIDMIEQAVGSMARNRPYLIEALHNFQMALTLSPNAQGFSRVGALYFQMGEYEKAIEAYQEALSMSPADVGSLTAIASVLQNKHDYAGAFEYLQKAVRIDPDGSTLLRSLAVVCAQLGKDDEVSRYVGLMPSSLLSDPVLCETMASVYEQREDHAAALSWFERILENDPRNTAIGLRAATSALRCNKAGTAAAIYKTILSYDPAAKDVTAGLADILCAQGDYGQAADYLHKAAAVQENKHWINMRLADIYGRLGKYNHAVTYYRKALKADPEDVTAYLALGDVYEKMRMDGQAEALYGKAIALFPRNARLREVRASARLRKNQYADALADIKQALEIEPRSLAAFKILGTIHVMLKMYDDALKVYGDALALYPGDIELHERRAAALREKGDYAGAVEALKRSLAFDPGRTWLYRTIAETAEEGKMRDTAVEYYLTSMAYAEDSGQVYVRIGNMLYDDRDYRQALDYYKKAEDGIGDDKAGLYVRIGETSDRAGRAEDAEIYYQKALAADRGQVKAMTLLADLHERRAAALREKGDYAGAVEALKRSLAFDPGRTWLYRTIAETAEEGKMRDTAIEYFREYSSLYPDSRETDLAIGQLYAEKKDYENALVYLKKGAGHARDTCSVFFLIADLCEKTGQLQEQIRYLKMALEECPQTAVIYQRMGDLHARAGDVQEALKNYERSFDENPRNAGLCETIALLYQKQQLYGKAEEYIKRALEIDPGRILLYRRLAELAEQSGETPRAMEYYRQYLLLDPQAGDICVILGELLFARGEAREGMEYMARSAQILPNKSQLYTRMAEMAMASARYGEAVKYLELSLELDPGCVYLYLLLARAYYSSGEDREAMRYYEKAELNGFDTVEVHQTLASLYRLHGDASNLRREIEALRRLKVDENVIRDLE